MNFPFFVYYVSTCCVFVCDIVYKQCSGKIVTQTSRKKNISSICEMQTNFQLKRLSKFLQICIYKVIYKFTFFRYVNCEKVTKKKLLQQTKSFVFLPFDTTQKELFHIINCTFSVIIQLLPTIVREIFIRTRTLT